MANPLFLTEFFNFLDFMEVSFSMKRYEVGQILKGGQIFGARMGKPRWMISGTLRTESLIEGVRLEAIFGKLNGMAGSFFAYDPRKPYPLQDGSGTAFAASGGSAQISGINSTNNGVKFSLLPNSYQLAYGDWFSIDIGTITYLHRILEGVTANGSGTTTTFALIEPPLMPGVAIGNPVNFAKPQGIFKLTPGGLKYPSASGNRSEGIAFEALQVL